MKGIGNASAQRKSAARVATVSPPTAPGPTVHVPVSNPQADKLDVIKGLEPWVAKNIEPMLVCPKTSWQPADFLPDPAQPDTFPDAVRAFQRECAELPPELMVVLVGDMVTEEALPSYLSMLNRMEGSKDESGGSDNAWARWNRGWTSEENRHGDLLNKMLYLSGAVDMRAIEVSIQHLLGTGFDPQLGTDAYRCFVYTSFQERATKISHQKTADLAGVHGAARVHNACSHIAGDEARHEAAYQRIMDQLFQRSPDAAVSAFADMMRATIVMPAHLMEDDPCAKATAQPDAANVANGAETPFFGNFAALADSLGVYTARDYASIMTHLMRRWHISSLQVESGEAAEAQEYLVAQEKRVWRMADLHMERAERQRRRGSRARFTCAWVNGKELQVQ